MNDNFKHCQFAHCESGVISNLLSSYGLKISEPMAFGLTGTLAFVYMPFIKINGLPLVAYRKLPRNIVKGISKILNIKMHTQTYSDMFKANSDLDRLIRNRKIVGLQTSVYYLPYFPEDMRFHFNAHNLLVFGKEDSQYLISDPVFEESVQCSGKDLIKARFAKGSFAPKGFIYYPEEIPQNIDFPVLIKKAIKINARTILSPFPYIGVKGMKKLSKKISKLKRNNDDRYLKNYLTHIVRMQEEIGTGGGGFRFLYAAFLSEAKKYEELNTKILDEASELLVKSGNTLRDFALYCVKASRNMDEFDPGKIAAKLNEAANYEKEAFILLRKI